MSDNQSELRPEADIRLYANDYPDVVINDHFVSDLVALIEARENEVPPICKPGAVIPYETINGKKYTSTDWIVGQLTHPNEQDTDTISPERMTHARAMNMARITHPSSEEEVTNE